MLQLLTTINPFSRTSDGSAGFLREGSFGWAMSLNNKNAIAHCSCPVYGSKPASYQAEQGYGLFSMIQILIRLSKNGLNTHALNKCCMASDNSSLVDTVIERQLPTKLLEDMDPNGPD
jgi:hypothetical protein